MGGRMKVIREAADVVSDELELIDTVLDRRLKFASEAWGYASAYDTAITVAGYGAFFALWAGVADDLTPAARAITVVLMAVSVLLYVTWTMLLMLVRHSWDGEFVRAMEIEDVRAAIEVWDDIEDRKRKRLLAIQNRWWGLVFGSAVVTGFAGAFVLVYNCLAVATGLPQ